MYEWLERAVEVKSTPVYIPAIHSDYNAEYYQYRTDPRFQSFLASIGLSDRART